MIERISNYLYDCWCWGDHIEQIKCSPKNHRLGAICRYVGAIVVTLLTLPLLIVVAQLQYGSITLLVLSTLYVIGGLRVYHSISQGTFGDPLDWLVITVVGATFFLWIATSIVFYFMERKRV